MRNLGRKGPWPQCLSALQRRSGRQASPSPFLGRGQGNIILPLLKAQRERGAGVKQDLCQQDHRRSERPTTAREMPQRAAPSHSSVTGGAADIAHTHRHHIYTPPSL